LPSRAEFDKVNVRLDNRVKGIISDMKLA